MSSYREIVYMCLDLLKLSSDDSFYNEDHIVYLIDKYRAQLLKTLYKDVRKDIPESNFQSVTLNLEVIEGIDGIATSGHYLRSIETLPEVLQIATPRVSTENFLKGNFTYVSKERLKYVGHNKWLKNFVYCTIGPDNKVYFRTTNPQMYYLETAVISAIFESPMDLSTSADPLDTECPIEEDLIPQLIDLIVKTIGSQEYKPEDDANNATDDLSKVALATSASQRRQQPQQ